MIMEAFLAYIGWKLGETAVAIFFVCSLAFILLMPGILRQRRCGHHSYTETGACTARCNLCGKDLGFIGTVREHNPDGEHWT